MASSPDVRHAETDAGGGVAGNDADSDRLAVMILDARHSNPHLVLANGAARRILTPAVAGAASFIGFPIRDWLAAGQAAVVTQTLAGLSMLRPSAHRTVTWPLIWGETPALTKFRLLDWDPGQAFVMVTFSASSCRPSYAAEPQAQPVTAHARDAGWVSAADPVPRGVAGMSAHLSNEREPPTRMRRSEDLLRATMANTADTLAFLDTSLRVRFVNKPHEGRSIDQIVGGELGMLLPPGAHEAVEARLRRLLATGEPLELQYESTDAEGRVRHEEIRAALVRDAGVGLGVCVSIRDVTELKRLEREILEVSTLERQRIGRDLHDGLGQDLTGVALMLRALATRLERECPSAATSANEIVGLVNQTLENARALAHGLLPVSGERGGLICALRSLATRTRDTYGLDVRFRAEMWPELRLDEAQASDLYRIAQEALTNVARHAKASWAKIVLHVSRDRYCLKIADNGVGIARPQPESGMGLKIMAHRADILGAKFAVLRNAPRGTLIRVAGPQAPPRS